MPALPTVLVTDVIRSSHQGNSHGGAYLVDLETRRWRQVLDWNDPGISWEGRGEGRGLRGIAFHRDEIYIAASDELFVFDKDFRRRRSFRNPYLRHCHEIFRDGDRLYLTSTAFDTVLAFDLAAGRFVHAWVFRFFGVQRDGQVVPTLRFAEFDPAGAGGPEAGDSTHINNVVVEDGRMYVSGVRLDRMLRVEGRTRATHAPLPTWTHNARPYRAGVLYNSTAADAICYQDLAGTVLERFRIPTYPERDLLRADLPKDFARQGFGRGLCATPDGLVIGGSSPSTVSVYAPGSPDPVVSVNISMDVRNAPHGLAIWPW